MASSCSLNSTALTKRAPGSIRTAALALACLASLGAPAAGTSVKDLTLSELVADADAIVHVKVVKRQTRWGQHLEQPAIVTDHAFGALAAPLRGKPVEALTLFGGELGEERQTLEGQPELLQGREYILLLIRGRAVQCPIVGVWKGAFEVHEGQVFQEGRPVVDVVADKVELGRDNERGMSPAALLAELRQRVQKQDEREQREEGGAR